MTRGFRARATVLVAVLGMALATLFTALASPAGASPQRSAALGRIGQSAGVTPSPAGILGTPSTQKAKPASVIDDQFGCPDGDACLFTDTTDAVLPTGSHPIKPYFYYGTYNLSGVVGKHHLDNNQTGGAIVKLCYGYNGVNCTVSFSTNGVILPYVVQGGLVNPDFTPINSIKLCASPSSC